MVLIAALLEMVTEVGAPMLLVNVAVLSGTVGVRAPVRAHRPLAAGPGPGAVDRMRGARGNHCERAEPRAPEQRGARESSACARRRSESRCWNVRRRAQTACVFLPAPPATHTNAFLPIPPHATRPGNPGRARCVFRPRGPAKRYGGKSARSIRVRLRPRRLAATCGFAATPAGASGRRVALASAHG